MIAIINKSCVTFLYFILSSTGNLAREEMVKSKLPNSVLRRVWALSDIDKDGMLDRDEFAVAMFLIDHKLKGNDIPETLPDRVIPPSKRAKPPRRGYHHEDSPGSSYRGGGGGGGGYGGSGGGYGGSGGGGGGGGYGGGYRNTEEESLRSPRRMGDYDDDESGGGLGGYVD